MDLYLLLVVTYLGLVYITLKEFRYELVSPASIFTIGFTFVIVLGYFYRDVMGVSLELLTYLLMSSAGIIFVGISIYFKKIKEHSRNKYLAHNAIIEFPKRKIFVVRNIFREDLFGKFIVRYLIGFGLAAIYVVLINTTGDSDISRMTQYRNQFLHLNGYTGTLTGLFVLSQFYKIALALTYINSYVHVFNSVMTNRSILKNKSYIFILLLFIVDSSIFNGARQAAIELVLFNLLVYLFIIIKLGKVNLLKLFLVKLIPLFILSPVIFWLTGILVGRTDGRGPMRIVVDYLAGGIYTLNNYIYNPARTQYWGQSSFADYYDKFANWGWIPDSARMSYHAFDKFGNTMTLYGRWYEDFGFLGVIIMSALVAIVFNYVYQYIMALTYDDKRTHLFSILFLMGSISLIWCGYDDRIRALLAPSQLIIFIITSVLFWVLYEVRGMVRKHNK